jgi:hypothetical protein
MPCVRPAQKHTQEQIIRFPPSFKFFPGADAHGFLDPSMYVRTYVRAGLPCLPVVLCSLPVSSPPPPFLLTDPTPTPRPTPFPPKTPITRLESLYKVAKKEGGKTGLRPPSYTDRVLVHSLPDERRRLRLRAVSGASIDDFFLWIGYEMMTRTCRGEASHPQCSPPLCTTTTTRRHRHRQYDLLEGVTSSDHRPVAQAMDLMVRRDIIGFEHVPPSKEAGEEDAPPVPFHVDAAICLCEVALSGLRLQLLKPKAKDKIGEARFLFPSLSEDPLKDQRTVLKLHDFMGFTSRHYSGAGEPSRAGGGNAQAPALVSRLTRFFSTATGGAASSASGASASGGANSTITGGSGGSGGSGADGQQQQQQQQQQRSGDAPAEAAVFGALGPGEPLVDPRLTDPTLLKSLHCFRWSAATRGADVDGPHSHDRAPVRFATLASIEHSTHALVKLVDKSGNDVGQGVLCLRGLVRRIAARNKRRRAPTAAMTPAPDATSAAVEGADDDALERGQQHQQHQHQQQAAGDEGEIVERMVVDLSRGGKFVGKMECSVSIRLVGPRPQQLQLMARDSSVPGEAWGGGRTVQWQEPEESLLSETGAVVD